MSTSIALILLVAVLIVLLLSILGALIKIHQVLEYQARQARALVQIAHDRGQGR